MILDDADFEDYAYGDMGQLCDEDDQGHVEEDHPVGVSRILLNWLASWAIWLELPCACRVEFQLLHNHLTVLTTSIIVRLLVYLETLPLSLFVSLYLSRAL